MLIENCKDWYNESYASQGFSAQRRYPNEELCRYVGRLKASASTSQKEPLSCLEVGCGSGANLWMLAEQGFDVYGLDVSAQSLILAREMLDSRGCTAELIEASMTDLPFADHSFDLIVDIFSSYCLCVEEFMVYLSEAFRVLKPGGRLFLYTPSKKSDAFLDFSPSALIDSCTVNGILRPNSPYFGNAYPFRFETKHGLECRARDSGFRVEYSEAVSRTYGNGSEYFEFLVMEVVRVNA